LDFLRRHVEKLTLGLALVALLVSIGLLMRSLGASRKTAAEREDEARLAISSGGAIQPLDAGLTAGNVYDTTPLNTLPAEGASPLRSNLFLPPDYILCYNETCNKLIPYLADNCPFCKTEQPPKRDSGPSGSDRDGDGIPNHIEHRLAFLNPDNPADARMDTDQDGFLNVEEFKAGTDMQDPNSTPPLGMLLRLDRLVERPLSIKLRRVSRNNSDDPTRWQITVQTYDTARRTWRNRLTNVGKTVDGFTIRSAAFIDDPERAGRQLGTVEVLIEGETEPYTLTEGKDTNERTPYARLYFFVSRNPQHARMCGIRMLMHKAGDTLTLSRGRAPRVTSETYRIETLTPTGVTVVRTEPAPAAGAEPLRIEVPVFNARTDFAVQGMSMGMDGAMPGMPGMDPAMMGDPGMMPAAPGGMVP